MKQLYLDIMEKSLSAYTVDHIIRYFNDVKRDGLTEHGFPRLTVNIGILIANDRRCDLIDLFLDMMDFCCREIPNKKAANDFSVREIIACISEIEKAKTFPTEKINLWKEDLKKIIPEMTYDRFATSLSDEVRNWALFSGVSELYRQNAGLCDSYDFIDLQLAQQTNWLDENGMYKDNEFSEIHQPTVYDLVSRGLFCLALDNGYRGSAYEKIDSALKKAAILTLKMQSPTGEIAYGGRSNQFLHNEAWLCIILEYEAKRYMREGDLALAKELKSAALRAALVAEGWLSKNPIRHIKNRYPTETKYGCEDYAYFDKYMITTASLFYAAMTICDDSISATSSQDKKTAVAKTSAHFHKLFLKSGGYGIEVDTNADTHYDSNGVGRLHLAQAPSTICLSCPCPEEPIIDLGPAPYNPLSLCSVVKGENSLLFGAQKSSRYSVLSLEEKGDGCCLSLLCSFENQREVKEDYTVCENGVSVNISSTGEIGYALPAFYFDGENYPVISATKNQLTVKYEGYICSYTTDGEIIDLDRLAKNRNGIYKTFVAFGVGSINVKIQITKE